MEEYNFKKSYFTIMIIFLTVAFVFLVFGYFASVGFAQRSYQQNIEEGQHSNRDGNHLARLDTDGDGKISQEEFPGPDEHFTKFDQDQNGYLSESELPKKPPECKKGNMRKRPSFSKLDKDSDGKISQEEFPGPDEHFTKFDEDNDGYLDEGELPKGPPRGNRKS